MESPGPSVLPPPAPIEPEPISRPDSASTTASQKEQLPGISSIAAAAAAAVAAAAPTSSPQPSGAITTSAPAAMYSAPKTAPAATSAGPGGNLPTCQNCQTSTTPLWRRDESGAVLCNACGLFLKLHGRARPISLKTDVIKSRNRVKTMRPGMEMKKKNQPVAPDANLADIQAQNAAAAALNASVRRPNQKPGNGHLDDNSPISRSATPNMYAGHMLYQGLEDHHLQQPLANFGTGAPGNGTTLNGDAVPQTPEELLAVNSGLKTRIDELEVINDLIQRRLQHYETYGPGPNPGAGLVEGGHDTTQAEAQLRAQVDAMSATEAQLRSQLDESHRRENNLKRRLDEMELELNDAKESLEAHENGRAKRPRLEEPVPVQDETMTGLEALTEVAKPEPEAPIDAPAPAPVEVAAEALAESSVPEPQVEPKDEPQAEPQIEPQAETQAETQAEPQVEAPIEEALQAAA